VNASDLRSKIRKKLKGERNDERERGKGPGNLGYSRLRWKREPPWGGRKPSSSGAGEVKVKAGGAAETGGNARTVLKEYKKTQRE